MTWTGTGGLSAPHPTSAPTLADLDTGDDLEVVLNTAHSGVVAYDLPGTEKARILWGTGRGNHQRTGSLLQKSSPTAHIIYAPLTTQ